MNVGEYYNGHKLFPPNILYGNGLALLVRVGVLNTIMMKYTALKNMKKTTLMTIDKTIPNPPNSNTAKTKPVMYDTIFILLFLKHNDKANN